uniref:collagen alpha-1(XXV) chain-like isoform X1 n=1 Tax=Oncorhynchus gorbuscha TaxID=8017 RepID=UPI001EAEC791|nr:collagen alpha-1(XXV) chain-like isoform X1 [Oncorhynchus gorbuscha]
MPSSEGGCWGDSSHFLSDVFSFQGRGGQRGPFGIPGIPTCLCLCLCVVRVLEATLGLREQKESLGAPGSAGIPATKGDRGPAGKSGQDGSPGTPSDKGFTGKVGMQDPQGPVGMHCRGTYCCQKPTLGGPIVTVETHSVYRATQEPWV